MESHKGEESQVDIFENDLNLLTSVFWELKLQEFSQHDTSKNAFPLKKIKLLMDEEIDEEFIPLKECGVLLSKMAELFVQDITLKSMHHQFNENKNSGTEILIQKEDVAMSLVDTEEYDFLVSSIVPEYEDVKKEDDSRFYITCTISEKLLHCIVTKDKSEKLVLNIQENINHKKYTLFPEEDDVKNGVLNFIIKSDLDSGKPVFSLNGYIKLGEIIIPTLKGFVERKDSVTKLVFEFNTTNDTEDGGINIKGKGKAILGDISKNTLVTVKFDLGDSNCFLVNDYICNTLYHTTYPLNFDNVIKT